MPAGGLRGRAARLALAVALGGLGACEDSALPDDDLHAVRAPEIARIVSADEALAGAHVPTLDPAPMNDAEIRKALAAAVRCEFRYTSRGRPVLAIEALPNGAASEGVVKLNGSLVMLRPSPGIATGVPEGGLLMVAGRIRARIMPVGSPSAEAGARETDMVFEIGDTLRAGYRGYYSCTG